MKKIVLSTILALCTAVASAASVTIEGQDISGVNGGADAKNYGLTVKGTLAPNLGADIGINQTVVDGTNALSTRAEAGLTPSIKLVGPFSAYMRGAVGQKFTNTADFTYYSVEPGIKANIGTTGLVATLGYRFRDAFTSSNNDKTETTRVGLAYSINDKNTVGVRYDRMRGDADANVWAVNYTLSF